MNEKLSCCEVKLVSIKFLSGPKDQTYVLDSAASGGHVQLRHCEHKDLLTHAQVSLTQATVI